MDSFPNEKVAASTDEHEYDVASQDSDELQLAATGKKQVLRRNFNIWSILGLVLSCTITYEGLLIVFTTGLIDGGPAGLIYGYLFTWGGYLAIIASLAELASMSPTAGGQYHWVYLFAPEKYKPIMSYVTGWQQVIAWQAILASGCFLVATLIQGLAILNNPGYALVAQRWHATLIMYAIVLMAATFNSLLGRFLPQIELSILTVHLCLFLGILVPLVYFAPHGSAHDVFGTFLSEGGYTSNGLTFFVGVTTPTFAFLGADAPIHLCEEVKGAAKIVPWAMVSAILINGTLGFGMLVAVLFCAGNITNALETDTGYPFLEIFQQALNSVKGATAMAAFITAMFLLATISIFAPAARMTWSFARDRGLPGSRWLGHVHPTWKLPLWSIGLCTLITMLLGLIEIGSTAAFNAIVSLVVAGFLGSYLLPVGLLVWMKLTKPHEIKYGPWKLGRWGLIVNILGLAWTVIAMLFSFFPAVVTDLSAVSMNWSSLLFGGTMIFALIFYAVYGRFNYKGPIVETTVAEQLS